MKWITLFVLSMFALPLNQTAYAMDDDIVVAQNISTSDSSIPPSSATENELPVVEVYGTSLNDSYVSPVASTGNRIDAPLMEMPMNVQVIARQVLMDQQATTLDKALTNVSGVISNSFGQGQETIFLRGFMTHTTLLNGFRIEDNLTVLTNVESIEVLKGPAAILYGAIEPGGVVNIITKRPQATPSYFIEQSVGSWRSFLTNLNATGPANEEKSVLFQVNASYDTSNSWIDGVYDKKTFIAPTFTWIINTSTQAIIEAQHTHNPFIFDSAQALPYVNGQFIHVPLGTNLGVTIPYIADSTFLQFRLGHQFNDQWSAKFHVGSNKATSDGAVPILADVTPSGNSFIASSYLIGIQGGKVNTTGTSLDVSGHFDTAGIKHTLLLGAEYYNTDKQIGYYGSAVIYSVDMFNPVYPGSPAPGFYSSDPSYGTAYLDTRTIDKGLYVQDQLELPHKVFVTAGLRQDDIETTGSTFLNFFAQGIASSSVSVPLHDSAVTPRVGLLWKAQSWLSIYGNYAGSLTANTGSDYLGNPLASSHARQYEAGIKAESPTGDMIATLAYYDLSKSNVPTTDPVHPNFQIAVGKLGSKGEELDIQGELQPNWNVIVAYAHNNTTVLQSDGSACASIGSYCAGDRFANIPLNIASIWTTYELKRELQGWKIGGGVTGQGSTTDQSNTINYPGFEVVNAMVSYTSKMQQGKLTVQLNLNNIFNKYYFTGNYSNGAAAGYATVNFGAPRNAVATARLEF